MADILSPGDLYSVLYRLGYYNGPPFQSFNDSGVASATKLFQHDLGLKPDGVPGPITSGVLRKYQAVLSQMPPDFEHAFRWKVTSYYIPCESDYQAMPTIEMLDVSSKKIADVPWRFFADVALEGTGRLKDGRLVNTSSMFVEPQSNYQQLLAFAQREGWVPHRPAYAGILVDSSGNQITKVEAFRVVPTIQCGYGFGVCSGIPLEPFKTCATDIGAERYSDPKFKGNGGVIPRGTTFTVLELVGKQFDTFTHDGQVRANDTGGGINGAHLDLFGGGAHTASSGMRGIPQWCHIWWSGIEQRFPYGYDYCLYNNPFAD